MIDKTSQFFAILTAVGEAKHANAIAMGLDWMFSEMGLGDANGTDPIPDRLQTQLINEWRRAPINQIRVDPANPNTVITEQIIPPEVGGEWIREIGLYDVDGDLVAVANCAPSYKPLLAQGTGKTQVVRMNFIVSSSANIVLKIDPAVVLATREYVDLKIQEELAKLDHKQSARVAAMVPITLSNVQTIDDVAVAAGDRVLVTAQAEAQDNGLYVVSADGWTRAADADNSLEVTPGLFIHVEQGTTNGDSLWQLVTDAPITLDTTGLQFEMIAGASGVGAGTYRSVTVDALGRVVAGTNPTTLEGYGITDALPVDGTAVAATQLETARTVSVSGAASGSAMFDGTEDADIAITLADSGIAPGTYSTVTVDAKGLVTGGDQLTGDDLGLGTAAYRNAQISIDDATAQALMMVGAFGIGGSGIVIPADTNLDTVILGGHYRVLTGGNIPSGGEFSPMLVITGSDVCAQIIISYLSGTIYSRGASGIGGTPVFTEWVSNWNTANFNPAAYQPALGFTPVQQGGGSAQDTNKIYIGYRSDSSQIRIQVDAWDHGAIWTETNFNPAHYQPALGFTPVRQGGGPYQGSNQINMGWDGGALRAAVDGTDQGGIWTDTVGTDKVRWANANLILGDVGTYGMFIVVANIGSGVLGPGTLVAGGNMGYSNAGGENYGTPSGTWMVLGGSANSSAGNIYSTTICKRVA